MQKKDSGFFGVGEAAHERAVLKNQAWKMAQVKGPVSNFFSQQMVLFVPLMQTGETPKSFHQWEFGRGQGQAGSV